MYGGAATPVPVLTIFDKQLILTAGQCNVPHWDQQLISYAEDAADPLGVTDVVTHRLPLDDACIKVVLEP